MRPTRRSFHAAVKFTVNRRTNGCVYRLNLITYISYHIGLVFSWYCYKKWCCKFWFVKILFIPIPVWKGSEWHSRRKAYVRGTIEGHQRTTGRGCFIWSLNEFRNVSIREEELTINTRPCLYVIFLSPFLKLFIYHLRLAVYLFFLPCIVYLVRLINFLVEFPFLCSEYENVAKLLLDL